MITPEPAVPPGSLPRILLVDDDQNLLDGLVRTHRRTYNLVAALGPAAGLEMVRNHGPFAVIVSDYTMPGMDGATFLRKVQEIAPDAVRMMLTGNAELQSAVNAVNQGAVFRFMRKPCEAEVFAAGLNLALRQHQLLQAEKQLLEQTLHGTIQVLTEVLSLVNPAAFGRARRVQHYVRTIVERLQLTPRWEFETAAMLSQLGCVTVPAELLSRAACGQTLLPNEQAIVDGHPRTAAELLRQIPRLEGVAEAVAGQGASCVAQPEAGMTARVLTAALEFERRVHGGMTTVAALTAMKADKGRFDPRVLTALDGVEALGEDCVVALLSLPQLRLGMVIAEDLHNDAGLLVVPKGQQVTQTLLTRLRNYAELGRIPLQFRVQTRAAEPAAT